MTTEQTRKSFCDAVWGECICYREVGHEKKGRYGGHWWTVAPQPFLNDGKIVNAVQLHFQHHEKMNRKEFADILSRGMQHEN